jgi:hypothetical protein
VPHSEEDQEAVFRGFRDRLEGLTKEQFGYTIDNVATNKERNLKALNDYVEGRNRIRAMFRQRPLDLGSASDRQKLADDISCSLSPENLTCDGELPRSVVQKKWRMLTQVRQQLERLDPQVAFYE